MKRNGKRQVIPLRPAADSRRLERPAQTDDGAGDLRQVHPVPRSHTGVLSVAVHLLRQFAARENKEMPQLSQDAATYLARQRWTSMELARRIARAVRSNRGSLITASDLQDPRR